MSSRQLEGVVNRVFRSRINEESRAWWDAAFLPRLEAKWDISNAFEGSDVKTMFFGIHLFVTPAAFSVIE